MPKAPILWTQWGEWARSVLCWFRIKSKPRCAHPKLSQKFFWSGGPIIQSSCPDCGLFDCGPVMTFETEEEWLAQNR